MYVACLILKWIINARLFDLKLGSMCSKNKEQSLSYPCHVTNTLNQTKTEYTKTLGSVLFHGLDIVLSVQVKFHSHEKQVCNEGDVTHHPICLKVHF